MQTFFEFSLFMLQKTAEWCNIYSIERGDLMDLTEKRKGVLINLAYFSVFVIIYYFFIKYALWIVAPFVVAMIVAMFLQKPIVHISKKTTKKIKKPLAVIFVLLVLSVAAGVLVLGGYFLIREFSDFGSYMVEKLKNIPALVEYLRTWLVDFSINFPDTIRNYLIESFDDISSTILNQTSGKPGISATSFDLSILATPLGGLWSTAKQIPAIFTAVLVSIIACFFITSDYDGFTGIIKRAVSPEHEKTLIRAKKIIINVLGQWVKSYASILFITFCEISLFLYILKWAGLYEGGYIFVIALCTAFLDILPVFGTGAVLIPWAVFSLFTHKVGLAIGLIVTYAIITVVRQVLEPKLVSKNVGMHPVITIMGMYIGVQAFGFLGLFILPITLVIIQTLNRERIIHIWGRYDDAKPSEEVLEKPAEATKK